MEKQESYRIKKTKKCMCTVRVVQGLLSAAAAAAVLLLLLLCCCAAAAATSAEQQQHSNSSRADPQPMCRHSPQPTAHSRYLTAVFIKSTLKINNSLLYLFLQQLQFRLQLLQIWTHSLFAEIVHMLQFMDTIIKLCNQLLVYNDMNCALKRQSYPHRIFDLESSTPFTI